MHLSEWDEHLPSEWRHVVRRMMRATKNQYLDALTSVTPEIVRQLLVEACMNESSPQKEPA